MTMTDTSEPAAASGPSARPDRTHERLPIVYVRGYAGPTAGIDSQVDDPFYGFNHGATHVRVGGDGDPSYYQFEGPLLRLITEEGYQLLVHGDQQQLLEDAEDGSIAPNSLWVYRFYDQAATTFAAPQHHGLLPDLMAKMHHRVSADGFDIETAARGLYDLILLVRRRTGAEKVYIVTHSMGGLVARCMMQKICFTDTDTDTDDRNVDRDGDGRPDGKHRLPPREIVARLFTYGGPHGGIAFDAQVLDWAEKAFGPAGSDIFAPDKMYGYLTPGAHFGDTAPHGTSWDPQRIDPEVFDPNDIFCLIGTDPKDYGASRVVVGPKSDGLVRIENAYVRGANRAYAYKSHSGSYGEVNSEEGYQNLRRFLFGRWQVKITLGGVVPPGERDGNQIWQADLALAVRGLPVVLSQQAAEHWCPIQLNDEIGRVVDTPDHPVPLASTFLLDPRTLPGAAAVRHGGRARHVLSLKVFQLDQRGGVFHFGEHLEQISDWNDALIVDVGPDDTGRFQAWANWNQAVLGANASVDPIGPPVELDGSNGRYRASIALPAAAQALPIFGAHACLGLEILDRATVAAQPADAHRS
ncbi:lipase family protein [Jatrophihabitans telluris]|uniref:Lipase family protein n=1 Tax=Jatrophihabitans telluris TaxID=2038343 RepID=A0ABY4QX10_9ACTN|nr:lipase family protein [Jatrophihabitans telluris]UQX88099.1 lipase family protein [Jatrophihabitans telluris]